GRPLLVFAALLPDITGLLSHRREDHFLGRWSHADEQKSEAVRLTRAGEIVSRTAWPRRCSGQYRSKRYSFRPDPRGLSATDRSPSPLSSRFPLSLSNAASLRETEQARRRAENRENTRGVAR